MANEIDEGATHIVVTRKQWREVNNQLATVLAREAEKDAELKRQHDAFAVMLGKDAMRARLDLIERAEAAEAQVKALRELLKAAKPYVPDALVPQIREALGAPRRTAKLTAEIMDDFTGPHCVDADGKTT